MDLVVWVIGWYVGTEIASYYHTKTCIMYKKTLERDKQLEAGAIEFAIWIIGIIYLI